VTSLQLLLDGRPYGGSAGVRKVAAGAGEAVKQTWAVELTPGRHTLRVLARSAASMGLSNDLEVTYDKPAPWPNLYVLAVGINVYKNPALRLRCAANDARELAQTFAARSKNLYNVETLVLTDGQATREGILRGLGRLKDRMRAQDLAVIYFACHSDKDDKGRFLLLPQDVDVHKLSQTAIPGEMLKSILAGLPGRVLLLLDACHSGKVRPVVNDMARDLADDDCGVAVLCAALGSEKAGEDPRVKHGYFCQALLEVLKGEHEAPRNPRDGKVYLHHVEQYVIDRVQELSSDEQHPFMAKPAMRPLPLAKP
jgi:uncharacterized caspase-like protein